MMIPDPSTREAVASAFRAHWLTIAMQISGGTSLAEQYQAGFLAVTQEARLDLARSHFELQRAERFATMATPEIIKQIKPWLNGISENDDDYLPLIKKIIGDIYVVMTEDRVLTLPSGSAELHDFLSDYDDPMFEVVIYKSTGEAYSGIETELAAAVLHRDVDIHAFTVMSVERGDLDPYGDNETSLNVRFSFSGEEHWPDHEPEPDEDEDDEGDDDDDEDSDGDEDGQGEEHGENGDGEGNAAAAAASSVPRGLTCRLVSISARDDVTFDVRFRVDGPAGSHFHGLVARLEDGGVGFDVDAATDAALEAMGETPDVSDMEGWRLRAVGEALDAQLARLSRSGILAPIER